VGLGPTAVVRLERALAHSWAPGLLAGAWGTGCRSCVARQGAWVWMVGRLRARDPTGAGTPQRPSTNATRPRYGGPAGRVKPGCPGPAGSTGTAHRPTSGAHPRAPGDRHAAGQRKTARPRLWTTACWGPSGVVSVSRVAGLFPTRRPRHFPAPEPRIGTYRGNRCTQAVDDGVDSPLRRPRRAVSVVSATDADGDAGRRPDHCSTMPTAGRPRPVPDETTRGAQRTSGRDSA
jgi:hypothetical protein